MRDRATEDTALNLILDLEMTVVCLREAMSSLTRLLAERPPVRDDAWQRSFDDALRYVRRTHAIYLTKMERFGSLQVRRARH